MSADYHVFGLTRMDSTLYYYLDDKLVCEWTSPDPAFMTMPRHLILSLEGHRYQPNTTMLPASFDIDWVRIYQKK